MNKQRFVVLFFLAAAAGFIAFLMTRQRREAPHVLTDSSPTPSASLVQPSFPDTALGLAEPTYAVPSLADFFPSSISVYTRVPRADESQEASRIAKIFGITQNPKVISGPPGTYYIFQSGIKGLVVGPGLTKIDYSVPPAAIPSALPEKDADLVEAATQLLSSLFPKTVFQSPAVSYYKESGNDLIFGNRASSTNIQLVYQPVLETLPLFVGYPSESVAVIRLKANKEVVYLSAPVYPILQKTGQLASIVSIEQARTRLISGRGGLLSAFSNQDINAPDTKEYSFSLSTISSAQLGYYLDPKLEVITPIFVFYGTATDKATRVPVETTSFVSALP